MPTAGRDQQEKLVSTHFSSRTRTTLRCGVVAGLVGGLVLTQQAFADTAHSAAAPSVSSSTAGPLNETAVSVAAVGKAKKKRVTSDVSRLRKLGITINGSVLIDVADDGRNRYLNIGEGGVVDFTGTPKSDDTNKMMSLKPAKVLKKTHSAKNRVVIVPPFYNEDLGKGSCVADVEKAVLRLATCETGASNQIWHVIPAGDSGQFELHGVHTKIRVSKGRIATGKKGYVGLQAIEFK
jgi:hypothetical protein